MKYFFLITFCFSILTEVHAQLIFKAEVTPSQKRTDLFQAGTLAVEHFSQELGYSYADFKKRLDEKFAVHFQEFQKRKLQEKFGNGVASLDEETKKKFLTDLDATKEEEFQKYSRILDAIQSYQVTTITKEDGPKSVIDVTLDRQKLNRLLKRIISDERKPYSTLWIITELTPSQFDWKDLGLEREDNMANPLSQSWLKWVSENLPESVEEVAICQNACRNFYEEWEQKSADQLTVVDNEYKHGIWLKVSLNVRRTQFNPSLNESFFEWDGKAVVLDVDTKRSLVGFNLPPEKKDWRDLDQKALNSALVSRLYRSPLPYFKDLESGLKKGQLNRVTRLIIRGHKNISDVMALIDLMKARGSSLGLDVKLDKIRPHEAEVLCYYQGEENSFGDLLSKLKELKSSTSYQLVNEFTGVQHVLKLVSE